MQLIRELTEDVEYIVESAEDGVKRTYITGPFLTANVANRNGRIYESSVMESAVEKYNTDYIQQKRALSELGHPSGPAVGLDRVSHIIESLKHDGKNHWIGKAKILESTPMGKIASALISEGVKLGVSSRGLGSLVEKNGVKYVQNDFFINAIDIVADPSGPECWVNGLQESIDYQMLDDGRIIQAIVDVKKHRIDEAKFLNAFSQYLTELSKGK